MIVNTILVALLVVAIGIAYQQSIQIRAADTIMEHQAVTDTDPISIAVRDFESAVELDPPNTFTQALRGTQKLAAPTLAPKPG